MDFLGKVMSLLFNMLSRFVIARVQLVKNSPACGRPGFNPWVGKILWRRERLPTPVFWPGEFYGLQSMGSLRVSDTTEQFSLSWFMASSKEQVSFNFVSAITVHSDFGAQENKICHCFHLFPIYLP